MILTSFSSRESTFQIPSIVLSAHRSHHHMDLLHYESDSSEDSTPDQQSPAAVPSFVTYLENYAMNRRNHATAFPFLLCELSQASRAKIRASLAQATKLIDKTNSPINKLYTSDNILDQISHGASALGTNNTELARRPHITVFPTCEGQKHKISQFNENVARRLRLWSPPDQLVCKSKSILDSMIGEEGGRSQIKLPLEPNLSILTLRTLNVLFVNLKIQRTPETETFLKGLSSLLTEQADSLNLKYDWWKHVGVGSIDECLYHVSFKVLTLKRPGTAVKFLDVLALEKAFKEHIQPMNDLSVTVNDLVIMNSQTQFKRIPIL